MKRSICGPLVCVVLTACVPTAYQKQTASLKGSVESLASARATLQTRPDTAAFTASIQEANALRSGEPVLFHDGCVASAEQAHDIALDNLIAGTGLASLYAPGGAMAERRNCLLTLDARAEAAKPQPISTASSVGSSEDRAAFRTAWAAELAADRQACRQPVPAAGKLPDAEGPAGSTADRLWAALVAYADGLASIASTTEQEAFDTAATGARDALKKLDDTPGEGPEGAAIDFLFSVFAAAIEQQRYEALRSSVVCGNAFLMEWRDLLVDALRYEQIAAYDARARTLRGNVVFLQAAYGDPVACSDVASPASWTQDRCNLRLARHTALESTQASPAEQWAAWDFLQDRAERLERHLDPLKAEVTTVNAVGSADLVPAVDALIAAHRALRSDVIANRGQSDAVIANLNELRTVTKALSDELDPAGEE